MNMLQSRSKYIDMRAIALSILFGTLLVPVKAFGGMELSERDDCERKVHSQIGNKLATNGISLAAPAIDCMYFVIISHRPPVFPFSSKARRV